MLNRAPQFISNNWDIIVVVFKWVTSVLAVIMILRIIYRISMDEAFLTDYLVLVLLALYLVFVFCFGFSFYFLKVKMRNFSL